MLLKNKIVPQSHSTIPTHDVLITKGENTFSGETRQVPSYPRAHI